MNHFIIQLILKETPVTPRSYSMRNRAASAAETRRRLIEATVTLHAERGILATKPADVAAKANVAITTYYKHFPSLESLVRACGGRLREIMPPPDPVSLAALPPDPAVCIAAMVRALFDDYEVRERWLYAGRTEERAIPELQESMKALRGVRDAFVRAALGDAAADPEAVGVATALVDFWAWRTLRREAALSQDQAIRAVTAAVQRVGSSGRSARDRSPTG